MVVVMKMVAEFRPLNLPVISSVGVYKVQLSKGGCVLLITKLLTVEL